jgi:hypothetical protein
MNETKPTYSTLELVRLHTEELRQHFDNLIMRDLLFKIFLLTITTTRIS